MAGVAEENRDEIKCKLHVLAHLKRPSDYEGVERDREIRIEIDSGDQLKKFAKTSRLEATIVDQNNTKWHTQQFSCDPPKNHKPMFDVTFLLSKEEANKAKKAKTKNEAHFNTVKFTLKDGENQIRNGEFQPKLSWNTSEFILFINAEQNTYECFPLLPVTLLISATSVENLSLEPYPQEITAEPTYRLCGQTNCLEAKFLLRLNAQNLETFDGKKLQLTVENKDQNRLLVIQCLNMEVLSYDLFRHYHNFHLSVQLSGSVEQQISVSHLIPQEINFVAPTGIRETDTEELYLVTNWSYNKGEIELKPDASRELFEGSCTVNVPRKFSFLFHLEQRGPNGSIHSTEKGLEVTKNKLNNFQIAGLNGAVQNSKPEDSNQTEFKFTVKLNEPLEDNHKLFLINNWSNKTKSEIKFAKSSDNQLTATSRQLLLLEDSSTNLSTLEKTELRFHIEKRKPGTQNSSVSYSSTTLKLSQGIEPGILVYNIRIDNLDSDPIVEPYMPTYQVPREQILHYFHSLLEKAGLRQYTFEDVKSTYAQRLVPQVRLDGGYDMRYAASRPYEIHDIWGFDGEKPPNEQPQQQQQQPQQQQQQQAPQIQQQHQPVSHPVTLLSPDGSTLILLGAAVINRPADYFLCQQPQIFPAQLPIPPPPVSLAPAAAAAAAASASADNADSEDQTGSGFETDQLISSGGFSAVDFFDDPLRRAACAADESGELQHQHQPNQPVLAGDLLSFDSFEIPLPSETGIKAERQSVASEVVEARQPINDEDGFDWDSIM